MQVLATRAVPILLCLLAAPGFASPRWTLLGPDGHDARILAVAPSNPSVVYATGFAQEGIFRSLDGGATWSWPEQATLVPGELATAVIAVDPQRAATVYLGSGSYGVAKSTDGGATWSPFRTFGLGRSEVLALAIDPHRTRVLFASLFAGGIFRSNDGGVTWTRKTAGLPPLSSQAQALAIDPRRPNVILAGYSPFQTGVTALYRSTDGGETWAPVPLPGTGAVTLLAFSQDRSATAYALGGGDRLYKSTNDGASWSPVPLPANLGFTALAVHPKDPRTLLVAAGFEGVFRSRDGGATWTRLDAGMTGFQPFVTLLTYNAQGTVAYAGTSNGVFQSSGGSWTRTMKGFATAEISAVALGPGDPPVLWAGAPSLGVYRSVNGGGVWRRSPLPEQVAWVRDIVADPDHPGTAWVLAESSPPGPFKTVDGGRTWSRLPVPGTSFRLLRDPQDGSLLLLQEGEILRSVDGGETWASSSAGIAAGDGLLDVAFDPASPQVLYAAGYRLSGQFPQSPEPRIYKSVDGGRTWARSDGGLAQAEVNRIVVSPAGVFAAVRSTLFRSTDAGAHWEPARVVPRYPGLPQEILDLVAAPDGTLYIGTFTGVFRTADGSDWTLVSDGLADLTVNDLLLDPLDPDHLFAATEAGGVAVLPLNE
jgi:photosystem II stability/assembly factor-like uncharacterized protein